VKLTDILYSIDAGQIALPEFQRGFVWNREQVRGLMTSLYRGYPVGGFLVWVTRTEGASARGGSDLAPGMVRLLLDGQQRVTTLYGLSRGRAPEFFDGNEKAFTGLMFNVVEETFEFYAPMRMKDDPFWVDVTSVLRDGIGPYIAMMGTPPWSDHDTEVLLGRLNRLQQIGSREFHIEEVAGEDKDLDIVVDIFNRVNSGGTKLSKGDLALARVCAGWPEARRELRDRTGRWESHGYAMTLDWFLRNITTILTDSSFFSALRDVTPDEFRDGIGRAERSIDRMLNLVASRLGLDHDRVLGGRYAFAVTSRFIDGLGRQMTGAEQGKLLYWYLHALMWGRYAGSVESNLNQDLQALREDGLDGLIERMRIWRGQLTVRPEDFAGWGVGARFYPILYMLTRTNGARDLGTGDALSAHMHGRMSALEVHHIHPKKLLYGHGYSKSQVNAVANFCFLSKESNLRISARDPHEYLAEAARNHPGVLESQWIPTDPSLWRIENYPAFLQARRQLLADAANRMLDDLRTGDAGDAEPARMITHIHVIAEASPELDDLDSLLEEQGLVAGARDFMVTDPVSGLEVAMVDAAWPHGIAGGYTQPLAIIFDVESEERRRLEGAGYAVFDHPDALLNWFEASQRVSVD
jgi:hypothetical protein